MTKSTTPRTAKTTTRAVKKAAATLEAELSVAVNLDTLEREGGDVEPFSFLLNEHRYTLKHPEDVDWQDLIAASANPVMFFRKTLPEEDLQAFFEAELPGWKLKVLMSKYQDYYGLPDAPNAAGLPR